MIAMSKSVVKKYLDKEKACVKTVLNYCLMFKLAGISSMQQFMVF